MSKEIKKKFDLNNPATYRGWKIQRPEGLFSLDFDPINEPATPYCYDTYFYETGKLEDGCFGSPAGLFDHLEKKFKITRDTIKKAGNYTPEGE